MHCAVVQASARRGIDSAKAEKTYDVVKEVALFAELGNDHARRLRAVFRDAKAELREALISRRLSEKLYDPPSGQCWGDRTRRAT